MGKIYDTRFKKGENPIIACGNGGTSDSINIDVSLKEKVNDIYYYNLSLVEPNCKECDNCKRILKLIPNGN